VKLSQHDLRQLDEGYLQRLPEAALRALSLTLLADLNDRVAGVGCGLTVSATVRQTMTVIAGKVTVDNLASLISICGLEPAFVRSRASTPAALRRSASALV